MNEQKPTKERLSEILRDIDTDIFRIKAFNKGIKLANPELEEYLIEPDFLETATEKLRGLITKLTYPPLELKMPLNLKELGDRDD